MAETRESSARTTLRRGSPAILALVVACFVAPAAPAQSEPRPLSEAERQAVVLAARYLAEGPAAWWDQLSTHSHLRAVGRDSALREIQVRVGPTAGARWELRTPGANVAPGTAIFSIGYPSGLDEVLVLSLVDERGALRLHDLKTLAEDARPGARTLPPAPSHTESRTVVLIALGFAVSGLAFGLAALLRANRVAVVAFTALGTAALGAALLVPRTPAKAAGKAPPSGDSLRGLGGLLALRHAFEAGSGDLKAQVNTLPPGPASDVAHVWLAQKALQSSVDEAQSALRALSFTAEIPWAHVLKARIGILRKSEVDAALGYEKAAELGPVHDGLLLEAAELLGGLGFDSQARAHIDALGKLGSRTADAHYVAAELALEANRPEDAEREFLLAWHLKPVDRRELFQGGSVAELLRRPAVQKDLDLGSASEPTPAPLPRPPRPVSLPVGAQALISGSLLRVVFSEDAALDVPGGADLAPAGTAAEDAGARARIEEARTLSQFAALGRNMPTVGSLAQPLLRLRIERMARALARHHRWGDLALLTASFAGSDEQVPAELLMLRADALRETDRKDQARQLLLDLSKAPAFKRRGNLAEMYRLGESLAALGEFDLGVRLIQTVSVRAPKEYLDDRIRQIHTEQRLSESYTPFASRHFAVRYPPERNGLFAERAGTILEAERARLLKWIPDVSERPVAVQLLWYEEFRRTYALGSDMLGLFDGKMRVPLAGVVRFEPPVVALMTHELTHALIADSTGGKAPHWFHEGLAQHLEMRRFRPNHIAFFVENGQFLSVPVIEDVLLGLPDAELVGRAYHEADWLLYYIEKRWGVPAIPRMLAAFRDGADTDQAVEKALSVSVAALDDGFREWALKEAPKMLTQEVLSYDIPIDEGWKTEKPVATDGAETEKPRRAKIPDSIRNSPLRHANPD